MLEQTHAAALVFARLGAEWIASTVSRAEAVLALPEIGLEIPIAEIYDGVVAG